MCWMAWTYWFLFHIKQAKPARERTDGNKAEGLMLTHVPQPSLMANAPAEDKTWTNIRDIFFIEFVSLYKRFGSLLCLIFFVLAV